MSRVPKLRFKEFRGEWDEQIVGDIGKVSMCKRILKEQTSPKGDIPFYKIGTFGQEPDAFISKKIFEEFKTKYSFPKQGDILISAAGTIGRTVVYDGLPAYFQDSNIVWIDNNEKIVSNAFLMYCYENTKWNTENTTIARLYNENLRNIPLVIPSKQEQQKIASFLSAVDTKIDQLTRKKKLLEQYKKGVMQRIFSQELRFKADDGNEFPEWEEKMLEEVAIVTMGSSPSSSAYNSENLGLPLLQGNADISERKSNPRIYTSEITKECLIGDILLSVRAPVGEIAKAYHHACIGRGIASIRAKNNIEQEYVYQLLLWFEPKWKRYSQGSTFEAVNSKDIKELALPIPSKLEQTKIANFLSALDTKIDLVTGQLNEAKNFKKGLLQQMFV